MQTHIKPLPIDINKARGNMVVDVLFFVFFNLLFYLYIIIAFQIQIQLISIGQLFPTLTHQAYI